MGHDEVLVMGRAEQARMARRHVFAINGDADFLDLVRTVFQLEGYAVTTTNYAPLTFDQIAALRPDLLLLDLAWGEAAGWDLLERLRMEARTRGIPVVVISTNPRFLDRVRDDHELYGGDALIVKPFDIKDLTEAVHRLLGDV